MREDPDPIDELLAATELLEAVARDRSLMDGLRHEERVRLVNAAGAVFSPDVEERRQQVKARRRREKQEKRQRDESVLTETGIRRLRAKAVFTTPNVFPPEDLEQATVDAEALAHGVGEEQHCYVCKRHYTHVHHFYDQLCPPCAELNFAKRSETADLRGRVALLTGGRVKIGYQAGIKLLRAGAALIVTTRFPRDAALRYAAEDDVDDWGDRLEVYGLDLRHTPSVEGFCHHVSTEYARLDVIVNNACQTVRRPADFYRHMLALETAALDTMPAHARALLGGVDGLRGPELITGRRPELVEAVAKTLAGVGRSAELSQAELLPEDAPDQGHLFPAGDLDQDLQQVDLRDRNSWRLTLAEVSSVELLETQLVNAVAPFVLNARLKPLMLRTPERDKHIVNVSAVEGQFYRRFKTTKHPHTNMAKAALNMMTRTSATDYHADGIHMNSVDTGWVSDEDPLPIAEQKRAEHRFHPPLDIVDGAARIVDPVIDGHNTGAHLWGQFLKDYRPTDW
ncbi:MAG: SDR family oxidoreductase [Acidimicrobiales bacterium]